MLERGPFSIEGDVRAYFFENVMKPIRDSNEKVVLIAEMRACSVKNLTTGEWIRVGTHIEQIFRIVELLSAKSQVIVITNPEDFTEQTYLCERIEDVVINETGREL